MSEELDLTPFCGKGESRPYLHAPFTQGDFTYATNGHICARVPRREGVVGAVEAPDASKIFPVATPPVSPLRIKKMPKPVMLDCLDCGAVGHLHDCPSCKCVCSECGGTGKYEQHRTMRLRGGLFSIVYIRMLAALPGIEVATAMPSLDATFYFRFEGGEGVLKGQSHEIGKAINAEAAP